MPVMSGETMISIISLMVGLLGLVAALVSLIAAYIFYRRGKKEKRPCFVIRTNNLIENKHPQFAGLEIRYKDREVQHVTVSHIEFWNDGRETITADDITTSDPLRITANNQAEILEVEVLRVDNPANQLKCTQQPNNNDHRIAFDYLDKDQGAVMQVIHTGMTSEDIHVIGQIKGVLLPIEKRNDRERTANSRMAGILESIPGLILAFILLIALGTVFMIYVDTATMPGGRENKADLSILQAIMISTGLTILLFVISVFSLDSK